MTIGILIVRGKILHQKRGSCKYVLPQKIKLTGQPLAERKISQSKKCIFRQEVSKNYKKQIFPVITTFYDVALKIETS